MEKQNKVFFYQLESLRGLAAILVVAFHLTNYFSPFNGIMLFKKGYIMVDLFFVLSGFVIYYNYNITLTSFPKIKEFILLRLGRIYPLHFFTTLIWLSAPAVEYVTKNYGLEKAEFSLNNTIANFLLIHNWGFKDYFAINSPSWSISTEFAAYIFFGLIIFLFAKNSKYFLLLSVFIAALGVLNFNSEDSLQPLSRCIFSFAIGCWINIIYKYYDLNFLRKVIPNPFIMIVILVFILEILYRFYNVNEYFIFPIFSAIFITSLLIYPLSNVVKFLEKKPCVKLGTLSYSIYMLHGIVITFGVRLFGIINININGFLGALLFIIFVFLSIYICSIISYKYIEKPFRDKIRIWVKN